MFCNCNDCDEKRTCALCKKPKTREEFTGGEWYHAGRLHSDKHTNLPKFDHKDAGIPECPFGPVCYQPITCRLKHDYNQPRYWPAEYHTRGTSRILVLGHLTHYFMTAFNHKTTTGKEGDIPGMIYDADLRLVSIDMLRGLEVVFRYLFHKASEHLLHPTAKMCWRTRMADADMNWCLHELLARLRAMALANEKELIRRKLVYQYPESQFSPLTRSPDTPNLRHANLCHWNSEMEEVLTPSANDEHGLPEGYNFNHRRFGWYKEMQGSGRDIIRKRNDIPENLPKSERLISNPLLDP